MKQIFENKRCFIVAISILLFSAAFAQVGQNYHFKCGLAAYLQAVADNDKEAIELYQQSKAAVLNKTFDTYLSPSGRFLIHFTTLDFDSIPSYDRDQNGTPDYLEFVAKSFDRAWEVEIGDLGFAIPPDSNGNPIQTYNIFCKLLGSSLYGATDFESIPGSNGRYSSRIRMNTNFSFVNYPITNDPVVRDSLAIAATAAHEFNHSLQLGYRLWEEDGRFPDLWLLEGSATYMEEVVADQVNDYLIFYDDCIYGSTNQHLTVNNFCGRIYGEALLYIMLGESYGKSITREIWEEVVNQQGFPSLIKVLEEKGTTITREMQRLAGWMFFAGTRALPGQFFPDAPLFAEPQVIQTGIPSFTNDENQLLHTGQLPPLSFLYLVIPGAATGGISISLAVDNVTSFWSASHLSASEPNITNYPAALFYSPEESGTTGADLYLAVSSGNWEEQNVTKVEPFQIFLKVTGNNLAEIFPNPVKPGLPSQVTFRNLPQNAIIEIYSPNGLHLATVKPQSSGKVAFWNLQTFKGEPVGSGVYIYSIVSDKKTQTGKIMVIQ